MKHLTEKHLIRISALVGLPLEKVVELDSLGLLSHSGVVSLVIRHDWKRLAHRKEGYTKEQLTRFLMDEYNVTASFVSSSVKAKRRMPYYCRECGAEIGNAEFRRNGGLCDHCVVKSIRIDEETKN